MELGSIQVGARPIPVWPEGQQFKVRGREVRILRTSFADTADYHPGLIARVLAMAQEPRHAAQYGRSLGGTKLYHLDQWDCQEARLLNARALSFCRAALGMTEPVVDIAWVNVYRKGDYIVPHSHTRSAFSLVYFLDEGDPDPEDPNAGRFCFVDPRLPDCCLIEEARMTNPLMPTTKPGTLLLFPSHLVHSVNPYGGAQPRITASWNINSQVIAGSPLDAFRAPGA
ncbi:MAG: putative 2OG-Fe(II) oxygenase [Kiloniellales bacterium]